MLACWLRKKSIKYYRQKIFLSRNLYLVLLFCTLKNVLYAVLIKVECTKYVLEEHDRVPMIYKDPEKFRLKGSSAFSQKTHLSNHIHWNLALWSGGPRHPSSLLPPYMAPLPHPDDIIQSFRETGI